MPGESVPTPDQVQQWDWEGVQDLQGELSEEVWDHKTTPVPHPVY